MRRQALAFLIIGTLLAAASVLLLPVFLGPLALLAAVGAIWNGARRPGAVLLLVAAVGMASGMLLGCVVACAR